MNFALRSVKVVSAFLLSGLIVCLYFQNGWSYSQAKAPVGMDAFIQSLDLADGLVAKWDMDEGTGSTTNDTSGNGHHGTINGATWTSGKIGSALSFDGVNDNVSIPDDDELDGMSSLSVSAWVKLNTATVPASLDSYTLIDKGDDTYRIFIGDTGHFHFDMNTTNGGCYLDSGYDFNNTDWFHIVGTYDGSTCRVYINGDEKASANLTGNIRTNSYDLWLGNNSRYTWRHWNGLIDHVAIHNRALSLEEISTLYAAGTLSINKSIQLSNDPPQPGDPITYTIVVVNSITDTTGVVISDTLPTYIDGVNLNQTVDITVGQSITFTLNATLSNSVPSEEVITNTASFSYAAISAQDSITFVVANTRLVPTVSVNSSLNPAKYGQVVTFTAIVSSTSITPTGTITFIIDGTPQSSVTLSAGQATYSTSSLAVGTHAISATYSGDANFNASSGSLAGGQVITNSHMCLAGNLVACYPFDGNADDTSGNGHHGTVYGATLSSDRKGNANSAYSFNGTTDYIGLGVLPGGDNLTMIAWFRSTNTGWGYIVGNHPFGNGAFLATNGTDGSIRFSLYLGGERYVDSQGIDSTDGQWHFVAGVYDGSSAKIYVDGVLNNTRTALSGSQPSFDAAIGRELFGGHNYFEGTIDQVAIYNRALSDSEIQNLYLTEIGSVETYLPVIQKNYIPPTPATISNPRYYVDVNSCTLGSGTVGSWYDIYFDFTDPNGDVIDGDFGWVDGYAVIEFFPHYQSGIIDFYLAYVYGYTTYPNDLTQGTINFDTLCVAFEENDSMRLTFTVIDGAGLESNSLPIDISRPIGGSSVQETSSPSVWSNQGK